MKHLSLAAALYEIGRIGSSTHRGARVLRFIFRHPKAHWRIIRQIKARDANRLRKAIAEKAAKRLAWSRNPTTAGALKSAKDRKPWKRTRRGA